MNLLFPRPTLSERSALVRILTRETVGGALMLTAALAAMIWANSPWSESYDTFRNFKFGPELLNLDIKHWVQDGLLAIFFMVAGLELKRELTHGDLRNPRNAALPIVAALGGMVAPAAIYLAIAWGDESARQGWAIPMATDIAFALAVLAIVGKNLPSSLRAFLLTLAIVDDVVAILIIAIVFTKDLNFTALGISGLVFAIYGITQRVGWTRWWVALPLALAAWVALHESGIHATVAGVVIGLLTSQQRQGARAAEERYEEALRPISAGVVVPLFALVSAGVALSSGFLSSIVEDRAALGVVTGLVVGKVMGITGASWLVARFTRAELNPELRWPDVFGISCVAGIGFTVSLLLSSLAFSGTERADRMTAAVLTGSLLATVLALVVLSWRRRFHTSVA